ncbi:Cartpt [Columba livia]|nr:Cartpt [Columba livia]
MEVKEQGKYGFAISTAQAMVVQDLELAALGFQGTFLLLPGLVEADFPAVHLPPASEQWQGKIEALQEVLEKLKSKRVPHYEKKFGQVPMCDAGEQCAVRKGARIGKLCDCPRGTSCNSFLLKCL